MANIIHPAATEGKSAIKKGKLDLHLGKERCAVGGSKTLKFKIWGGSDLMIMTLCAPYMDKNFPGLVEFLAWGDINHPPTHSMKPW